MIKGFLLGLSLLNPHHKRDQQRQHEIDTMTRKAAAHVMAIRMATTAIHDNCPYVPGLYFDAMQRDLDKIALDRDAAAPSFRQDFDNLEDDFHSLLFATVVYEKMDNI